MWLCILMSFEDTFENAQWGKVKQMQAMWLSILSGRPFEEPHENAQWRKVKQMQPMCLCIFSGRQFKDTHAIQKSRKIPVFYFQKYRYRYLCPISVYRYFPVYRRGLLMTHQLSSKSNELSNISVIRSFEIKFSSPCESHHVVKILINFSEGEKYSYKTQPAFSEQGVREASHERSVLTKH